MKPRFVDTICCFSTICCFPQWAEKNQPICFLKIITQKNNDLFSNGFHNKLMLFSQLPFAKTGIIGLLGN